MCQKTNKFKTNVLEAISKLNLQNSQFNICCCVQNFIKIGWFFTEIWRYIDFQNDGRPPSWNCFTTIRDHLRSLCCWPQLPVKFHVNLIHRSEAVFGPRHGCGWASTTGDTGTVRVGSINALSQTSNTCTSLVKHRLIEVRCSFTEAYIWLTFHDSTRRTGQQLLQLMLLRAVGCVAATIATVWIFSIFAWNAYSGPQNGGFDGLWTSVRVVNEKERERRAPNARESRRRRRWGGWRLGRGYPPP